MRTLFILASFFGLGACQSTTQKSDQAQTDTTAVIPDTVAQTEKPSNFFVLTSWATTDRNKAMAYVPNQQKQLMGLWRKGIVENIYYNQKGKFADGQPLVLIGFFLKGLTEAQAHQALDTTDVVKTNLANYSLQLVGQPVFGRSDKALTISAAGTETYAVIWAFLVNRDSLDRAVLGEQMNLNIRLQREGIYRFTVFRGQCGRHSASGLLYQC
ncbi:hypothetical protein [Spirosoma jeollabukense]